MSEWDDERPASRPRRRVVTPVKPTAIPDSPTPDVLRWLAKRGISEVTARRNKIGAARHFIPKLNATVDCVAFPYFRNGELVNIKFRALTEKAFAQVKGAEKILYGLDDIANEKSEIIVEGECDKLALEKADIRNVVSVPDGAPAKVKTGDPYPEDAKFVFSQIALTPSIGSTASFSASIMTSPAMRLRRN